VAEEPEGAQLSEDGNYWWDGQDWQPRDSAAPPPAGESGESGTGYVSDWFEAQGPDDLPPEVVELATQIQAQIDSDPFFSELGSVDIEALGQPVE
jgi:hypothetical protein